MRNFENKDATDRTYCSFFPRRLSLRSKSSYACTAEYLREAELVDRVHDPLAVRPVHRDECLQLLSRDGDGRGGREVTSSWKLRELLARRERVADAAAGRAATGAAAAAHHQEIVVIREEVLRRLVLGPPRGCGGCGSGSGGRKVHGAFPAAVAPAAVAPATDTRRGVALDVSLPKFFSVIVHI